MAVVVTRIITTLLFLLPLRLEKNTVFECEVLCAIKAIVILTALRVSDL